MKFNVILLFCLSMTLVHGQWKEVFETNLDTAWVGDRSHFMVNANQQLQLSAMALGNSLLLHPFDNSDSLQWTFYFKMAFAPSSTNRMNIILMTDRLKQDSANTYLLEIGESGNNDRWKFYVKQSQSKILIAEGPSTKLAGDPALARMMIQKNTDNSWTISSDYSGNSQFILESTILNVPDLKITYPFFGVHCFYTETRRDHFFLDDVCIGSPILDQQAPRIIRAVVVSDSVLQIQFNEPVDSLTSLELKKYQLDGSIFPAQAKIISGDQVELKFPLKFISARNYRLHYDSIRDVKGNLALNQFYDFIWESQQQATALDILITEFMADPSPPVGLPEKEFVEIKNTSNQKFDLQDYVLTDGSTESRLPKYQLEANAYLILCNVRDTLEFKFFGKVLGLSSFPSLNNSGDLIGLKNKNHEFIHEVNYEDSWYRSIIKKDGGYTLEMINTGIPCAGKENWIASNYFSGGTPGTENSNSLYQKDSDGPKLLDIYPLNEFFIKLIFDEKLHQGISSSLNLFSIYPLRSIASVDILSPSDNVLVLVLNEPLEKGIRYKLSIQMVSDCLGNPSMIESNEFALPAEPIYRDLVWSEVLFDPNSGGSDFVELYNRSNKVLSLNKLMIKNDTKNDLWHPILSDRIILPNSYIALTLDPETLIRMYSKSDSSKIIKSQIPSIDDVGGNLQLAYNNNNALLLLDSFSFTKGWHHPFLHNVEGVSLEKINMESFSGNRNNWQSATAAFGYGTPGVANSQYVDTSRFNDVKPYLLSSQIISPNGDSFRDFLSISFQLNKSGYKSRIEVYDLSGQKRKSISFGLLFAQDLIVWNGDDDLGSLLPVGNYILYLELLHPEGDRMNFKERIVIDH